MNLDYNKKFSSLYKNQQTFRKEDYSIRNERNNNEEIIKFEEDSLSSEDSLKNNKFNQISITRGKLESTILSQKSNKISKIQRKLMAINREEPIFNPLNKKIVNKLDNQNSLLTTNLLKTNINREEICVSYPLQKVLHFFKIY